MARTRSLQNLLSDVRWTADEEASTSRHTDFMITRALNQSIQAFRRMVTRGGIDYYEHATSGNLTANVATLTGPADLVEVTGLDVSVDGELRDVYPISRSERNDFQPGGAQTGVPVGFRIVEDATITLYPTPDAAYAYQLWYLQTGTDLTGTFDANGALTASTSTFDGLSGWEDWIVYDTALRLATRDGAVNDNYELLSDGLAKIEVRILSDRRRVSSGPLRRKDSRGRRSYTKTVARFR